MSKYRITITTENDIPEDVLREHLENTMETFKFAGDITVDLDKYPIGIEKFATGGIVMGSQSVLVGDPRSHPFDGPVLFDDVISSESQGEDIRTAAGSLVLGVEALEYLKKRRQASGDN